MDCKQAVSAVFDPTGTRIFSGSSENSKVFFADIPLDAKGRFGNTHRQRLMRSREIDLYRQIYLDPWVENLTLYYQLPETGMLDVHCFVPEPGRINLTALETAIAERNTDHPALWVLPALSEDQVQEENLLKIAKNHGVAFALSLPATKGTQIPSLITPKVFRPLLNSMLSRHRPFPLKFSITDQPPLP